MMMLAHNPYNVLNHTEWDSSLNYIKKKRIEKNRIIL